MELGSLGGDGVEALAELGLGDGAVGGEVEEVVLLGVELGEGGLGLAVKEGGGAVLVGEGEADLAAEPVDDLGPELDLAVVAGDRVLDVFDADVALVAQSLLACGAEPVEVLAAVAVGALDQQPRGAALLVAAAAVDGALQVVVVATLAFLADSAAFEDLLDPLESLEVDERLVSSLVLLALVGDDPDVIGVPQELGELGVGDRAGWEPSGSGAEASGGELVAEGGEGVLAGGVELEGGADQFGSLGVELHPSDLGAVDPFAVVEVAEGCSAEGPTGLGLLAHLVADVGAVFGGPELVEGREDALHELADGAVVDALGGRDEGDSVLAELCHHEGFFDAVPVHPGELVDDDVVDVALVADPGEHRLEGGPLIHRGGGLAGLDELADDLDAGHLGDLRFALGPLGGDGDAVGVVFGFYLAGGADSQVEHSALGL